MLKRLISLLFVAILPQLGFAQDGLPDSHTSDSGLPEWLEISGAFRTRYETIDDQLRVGFEGSAQGLFNRALLKGVARFDSFDATLELVDSRHLGAPDDTALNTGIVNALDILQANVVFRGTSVFSGGDEGSLTLGRQTLDIGSRRLVGRNGFRNTINNYTGLRGDWQNDSGDKLRAFFFFPVRRLPRDAAGLQGNDVEADEERTQVKFFGVHGTSTSLFDGWSTEAYAFGLDEDDGRELGTRNRQLWTLGTRWLKKPSSGKFNYEVEAIWQTGESRASTSGADTTDLDHDAQFVHAHAGYQWDHDLKPRLELIFDYGSGDKDPGDGENNRFDTLFGPRLEYGITGIFGPFQRSNLISPGLRLHLRPKDELGIMLHSRLNYLASNQDGWVPSGHVDPSGNSGDYIGHLTELRFRYEPKSYVRWDAGISYLSLGSFVDEAPNNSPQRDSTYAYFGVTFKF